MSKNTIQKVVIDPGNQTCRALCIQQDVDDLVQIVGEATVPAEGFKRGQVIDMAQATACLQQLRELLHKQGVHAKEVILGMAGRFLHSKTDMSQIDIGGRRIKSQTLQGLELMLPEECIRLSSTRHYYELDGQRLDNVMGMEGDILSAKMTDIYIDKTALSRWHEVFKQADFEVAWSNIYPACKAACYAIGELDERTALLLIDIGAGTTDYIVMQKGKVHKLGVIPIGGDDITHDIAFYLHIDTEQAEVLKVRYGEAHISDKKNEKISYDTHKQVMSNTLNKIIKARLDEILECVKHQVQDYSPFHKVVLCGQVAQTPYLILNVAGIFGVPCEIAHHDTEMLPQVDEKFSMPDMSVLLGLTTFAMEREKKSSKKTTFWSNLKKTVFSDD